jgi:hypothetical protein
VMDFDFFILVERYVEKEYNPEPIEIVHNN